WLLCMDGSFAARVRDPFAARSRVYKLPVALVCDALKIAYTTQHRAQYREVFFMIRGVRRALNVQIRVVGALRLGRVAACLAVLKSYWPAGGSGAESGRQE